MPLCIIQWHYNTVVDVIGLTYHLHGNDTNGGGANGDD